jgi:PAS domain S-box-containing protein
MNPATQLDMLFPGESEMAGRMRAFDWAASALGPTERWPENLRVAVRLCLSSHLPTCLWWGVEFVCLYNDGFLPWLTLTETTHSSAFMRPCREVWGEEWGAMAPMLSDVVATGKARWSRDTHLPQPLQVDATRVAWSFTPMYAADGGSVEGVLGLCSQSIEKKAGSARSGHEALEHEKSLRRSAEDAETKTRHELTVDLAAMTRLHRLSNRLLSNTRLQPMLEEVLDASMALMSADFGVVQLYDDATNALKIVAQRGFKQDFLAYFNSVRDGTACCGEALRRMQRVIVEDVWTSPIFQPHLSIVAAAGFRGVQSTPLFGKDGRVLGMLSTHFRQPHRPSDHELRFMDLYASQAAQLIQRKRAEEALRVSEERFRRYFDLGLIGMAITSPSKGCVEVNDELCRMLGYERDELLQKSWVDLTHPDDLAADESQFARVMAGEIDGYTLDKRWIRADGRVMHSIMAAKCVRRDNGTVDFFVGLVQDITTRKFAVEQLAESERRFRLLAESIPHHVWSFRPDPVAVMERSTLGYWNRRLMDYTGLSEEELRQGGWSALHPDDVERVRSAWQVARALGTDYHTEQRVRGRDGRYRRFVSHGVPVKDAQGRPVEWFGTDSDVEDRRQAEEAQHRLQAELAHVARVTTLGEMAASIAHEINQPLAAMVANGHACAHWLEATPPKLGEVAAIVRHMVRDANRAAEVIQRIRSFLQRGGGERTAVDLAAVVSAVVAMAQTEIRARNVSLRVIAAKGLPPVLADRTQLQQVVLNLIMNAIEAMSAVADRPRTLEIAVRRHDADMLRVSVCDSGEGIAPEHRDRIFVAFHTTKPDGMGMGLSIARSIVEAHGGVLWATPNDDHGETFVFTLPVAPP